MTQYSDSLLIEELNKIHEGKTDPKVIEERKQTFDLLIQNMISAGVVDQKELTETFKNIWEELKVLQERENCKELLTTISSFHDDLAALEVEAGKFLSEETKAESNENSVLGIVERMHAKCGKIAQSAQECWKSDQYHTENAKRYFNLEKIKKVSESLGKILDKLVHFSIESVKWPLQMEPGNKAEEVLKRVLGLISGGFALPAIEPFTKVIESLPEIFVKHYISRLKVRVQYHFAPDSETKKADRPELILNYLFDQARVLKQYMEDLGRENAFLAIRVPVLNEIMNILIENYKQTSTTLKETIRLFFIYLEEVSLFQARLNQHFGYICDEQHSLFYYILKDKINESPVSEIWKKVDRKLAERRIAEIMASIAPNTGEEIESLLEHYIKSYSTLPRDLRESFYFNSEEYVLKKVLSDFGNRVMSLDYWKLLKKQTTKEVVEFTLALDKTIKGIKRQKEGVFSNERVKHFYQYYVDELIRTRKKLYDNCAINIARSLLLVMQRDFESTRDKARKMNKFTNSARKVVDSFFKKLIAAELYHSVAEIQDFILKAVIRHLGGENWTKVLAKFQKEAIKQQFFEMGDLFAEVLVDVKEAPSYDSWKSAVEYELSK